jgi:hypothetical protein
VVGPRLHSLKCPLRSAIACLIAGKDRRCECHVIDKDRQDDANITSDIDIDSSVRIRLFEAHELQSGAHLAIPVISTFLGATE